MKVEFLCATSISAEAEHKSSSFSHLFIGGKDKGGRKLVIRMIK